MLAVLPSKINNFAPSHLGVNIKCILVITHVNVHDHALEILKRTGTLNRPYALLEGTCRECAQDKAKVRHRQGLAPFAIGKGKYFLGCARLTVPPLGLGYCDDLRSFVTVTVTDDPKLWPFMHPAALTKMLAIQIVGCQYRVHGREPIHVVCAGNGIYWNWGVATVLDRADYDFHQGPPSSQRRIELPNIGPKCPRMLREKAIFGLPKPSVTPHS